MMESQKQDYYKTLKNIPVHIIKDYLNEYKSDNHNRVFTKKWMIPEIRHQVKGQQLNKLQKETKQFIKKINSVKVVFTQPEVLSLGEWGEVIRITLNKPPEDVQGFCKWLQHTVNKQLGET